MVEFFTEDNKSAGQIGKFFHSNMKICLPSAIYLTLLSAKTNSQRFIPSHRILNRTLIATIERLEDMKVTAFPVG
jgi:hypothetical protein